MFKLTLCLQNDFLCPMLSLKGPIWWAFYYSFLIETDICDAIAASKAKSAQPSGHSSYSFIFVFCDLTRLWGKNSPVPGLLPTIQWVVWGLSLGIHSDTVMKLCWQRGGGRVDDSLVLLVWQIAITEVMTMLKEQEICQLW